MIVLTFMGIWHYSPTKNTHLGVVNMLLPEFVCAGVNTSLTLEICNHQKPGYNKQVDVQVQIQIWQHYKSGYNNKQVDVQAPLLVVGVGHNSSSAGTGVHCVANISGLPLTHSGGIVWDYMGSYGSI